jgi:hypothetical protein
VHAKDHSVIYTYNSHEKIKGSVKVSIDNFFKAMQGTCLTKSVSLGMKVVIVILQLFLWFLGLD